MPKLQVVPSNADSLMSYFDRCPDLITVHDRSGIVLYQSPSAARMLGYDQASLLGADPFELIHREDAERVRGAFDGLLSGRAPRAPIECRVRRADSRWTWLESVGSRLGADSHDPRVVITSREITERKISEGRMRRRLREFSILNAAGQLASEAEDEGAFMVKVTSVIRDAMHPNACRVLLLDAPSGVLTPWTASSDRDSAAGSERIPIGAGIAGKVALTGLSCLAPDARDEGQSFPTGAKAWSELCVPLTAGSRMIGVLQATSANFDAFSEADERFLSSLGRVLAVTLARLRSVEALRRSEERLRRLSEFSFEGICLSEGGRVVDANARLAEMLGYTVEEIRQLHLSDLVAPEEREIANRRVESGTEAPCELTAVRRDGDRLPVGIQARTITLGGRMVRVSSIWDVTELRRAVDERQVQVERLAALREIDSCITGRLDLKTTLETVLNHVVAQLRADAAAVFLLEDGTGPLRLAASKGAQLIGEELAQRFLDSLWPAEAALGMSAAGDGGSARALPQPVESHVCGAGESRDCCAVPLVVKGKIKGVLEVVHNEAFEPNQEWVEFLEALAGQAAIAVDNISLVEDLQRSNFELEQAYDQIIEGWSRALELRDRETQGHATRVTDMTVRLARALGIAREELVHVRRGALLHDIGKMGIADSILLKPGPLTDEEWVVMRRHVEHALHLLSPIEFLQPALDIPLCHHERWDGLGYPRGLKGEAIPLAARAFSVVDTWDALSHDRPYRAAWPSERIVQFLLEQSGKAYDPAAVAAFVRLRRR